MFSILFAYLYVPHTAFCVSVGEGKGLRAHVTIVCAFSYRETCCLHGSHFSDTPAWTLLLVSDTHACVLPMVSDTQTCIVRSPPNISYKTCHCGAVGGATIARQATVQLTGGRKFCKKIQKVMLKIFLAKENVKVVPLVYLRVLAYFFLVRNLGKTWQQWLQSLQGGGGASLFRHACMHAC